MTVIHQIGSISITILMDNSTDFLLTNSSHAIRQQLIKYEKFILPPWFSALVRQKLTPHWEKLTCYDPDETITQELDCYLKKNLSVPQKYQDYIKLVVTRPI